MESITAQQLSTRMADPDNPLTLLDVREDWEVALCQIEPGTHIPMGTIPNRLSEFKNDQAIVVICHHGMRSMQVANFMEQQGFTQMINLTGGIDAWAREVDQTMAVY